MNSDQLLYFKAVAEVECISRAAEKLHVTPPLLSITIRNLEDELGCKLFDRDKKRIILNEDGRKLLKFCDELSNIMDRIPQEVGSRNANHDKILHVKTTYSLMGYELPLDFYNNIGKNVEIEGVSHSNAISELLVGADAVIDDDRDWETAKIPGLRKQFLFEQILHLVVPKNHPWVNMERVSIEDVAKLDLVGYKSSNEGDFTWWIAEIARLSHVKLNIVYTVEEKYCPDILAYVSFPFLDDRSKPPFNRTDIKQHIPVDAPFNRRKFYIWYQRQKEEKIRLFLDEMRLVSNNTK